MKCSIPQTINQVLFYLSYPYKSTEQINNAINKQINVNAATKLFAMSGAQNCIKSCTIQLRHQIVQKKIKKQKNQGWKWILPRA